MNFDKIHNISKTQPYVILTVRFIMILICSQVIFSPCKTIIRNTLNKDLSLIKITHYLMRNPEKIIQIILDLYKFPKKLSKSIQAIARYCSYDKKKSNFQQDMESVFCKLDAYAHRDKILVDR